MLHEERKKLTEDELKKLVITLEMSDGRIKVKHFGFSPEYERKEEVGKCATKD